GAVVLLEEEPLLLLLPHAHQRPAPAKLEPEELQLHLAALVLLVDVLGLERAEPAVIPDDHGSRPVVAGGDHALEGAVLQRMILDVDRQPLLLDARGGPLRDRPALQRAVQLEPEVVVHVARPVLLDDETRGGSGSGGFRARSLPERLGSALGVPFTAVVFELGVAGRAHYCPKNVDDRSRG